MEVVYLMDSQDGEVGLIKTVCVQSRAIIQEIKKIIHKQTQTSYFNVCK